MCVEPPTSSTWSTCAHVSPASARTCCVVSRVRMSRSCVSVSNSARETGTVSSWPACDDGHARLFDLPEGALGPLGGGVEHRRGLRIVARVGAVLVPELLRGPVRDAVVPVLAAEPHVALDGERLEALLREPHQRHVEGAAAEVVDEDRVAWPKPASRCWTE